MPSFAEKLAAFFWRHRKLFVVCLILISCVFGFYAIRVKPDNSLEAITVENDPTMMLLKRVEKKYGSEEFISIAFETDSVFDAKTLATVERLTQKIAKVDGIADVLSLTTIWRFAQDSVDGQSQLAIKNFIEPGWIETGVPQDLRPKLLAEPLYQKLIYSPDGKVTAILAQLKVIGGDDAKRTHIVTAARAILKEEGEKSGFNFLLWGNPVIHRNAFGVIEKEQNLLPVYMLIAVMVLMYFSYRSAFIGVSPLILLGLVFVIVLGTLGMFGINFNWLTSIVPAVIMIVSVCDTMHVINEYLASKETGEAAVKSIYKSVGLPSLITGLTTALGFLSLLSVPIKPVREFGLYVAFGVVLAFIFTFTVFILILNAGPKAFKHSKPRKTHPAVLKFLDLSLGVVIKHPKRILIVTAVCLIVSVFGIFQIKVNSKMLNIFKDDVFEMEKANAFLRRGAGGGVECYLIIESDKPGRFYDPEILRRMDELETLVSKQFPEVLKSLSIVDFVKYVNMVLHDGDKNHYRIPDSPEEVAQIFLLLENEKDKTQWASFVNLDYSAARIRTFSEVATDSERVLFIGDIVTKDIERIMPDDVTAQFTGRPFATANMMKYLSQAMINSTVTSGLVISLVLIIMYRSVYVGLISSVPNLITIIIGMGLMGYMGIQVNLATSMAFAIAMGIADDDMVHMVWHMRDHVRAGDSYEMALKKTFDEVGVPIVTSTIVLVGGFMMLGLSKVWPTTQLGIVVSVCCTVALFATTFVAAAMLLLLKPFKKV